MSNPWFKFYSSDWRSDPALRMCSMAARGRWMEMSCLMHEATPYGHLLVKGHSPTEAQLAVLAGAPSDEIAALLGELELAGVFSRTRAGVIYSRKMTAMAKKAATARNNGRKGGNPSLSKQTDNSPSVKGGVKGLDKTQKPEARNQRVEDTDVSSLAKPSNDAGFADFWDLWPSKTNKRAALTAWKKLSYENKRKAYAAIRGGWFDRWQAGSPDANPIHAATFLNKHRWEDAAHPITPKLTAIQGGQHGTTSNHPDRLQRTITAAAAGTSGQDWG